LTKETFINYSASMAELGSKAGQITWDNALGYKMILKPAELESARRYIESTGGWDKYEIEEMSNNEINALIIQFVTGDIREFSDEPLDSWNWDEYEQQSRLGIIAGNIFKGDNGDYYYYLG